MEKARGEGEVQTILESMKVDDLGIVLTLEHLLGDFSIYFPEPSNPFEKELARQLVSVSNLSWVRSKFDTHSLDNLLIMDEEIAIAEAMRFKIAGGSTLINLTPNHIEQSFRIAQYRPKHRPQCNYGYSILCERRVSARPEDVGFSNNLEQVSAFVSSDVQTLLGYQRDVLERSKVLDRINTRGGIT